MSELVDIRVRRKLVARADVDQRCVLLPVNADWEGTVAPAVEKMQRKGELGSQKVLVIRDGQPLLLNGWSRVVTEESIRGG